MKYVGTSYEILTPITGDELKTIETAARTCYKSEDKIGEGSAEKMVVNLIRYGHEAMLEHGYLTVKFVVDRALSHELVRHRLASFAQESQRYCNYSKDKFDNEVTFIKPFWMDENCEGFYDWQYLCKQAEEVYFAMLGYGYSPQLARMVLPNCTKTEVVITANYREWRHILKLRTAADAHPEMIELMQSLLKDLQDKIPILFDDIMVGQIPKLKN